MGLTVKFADCHSRYNNVEPSHRMQFKQWIMRWLTPFSIFTTLQTGGQCDRQYDFKMNVSIGIIKIAITVGASQELLGKLYDCMKLHEITSINPKLKLLSRFFITSQHADA